MKKILILPVVIALVLTGVIIVNAEEYITGYDVNNGCAEVKVEKGVHTPGISLTKEACTRRFCTPRGNGLERCQNDQHFFRDEPKGAKKVTLFLTTIIPSTATRATTTFRCPYPEMIPLTSIQQTGRQRNQYQRAKFNPSSQ